MSEKNQSDRKQKFVEKKVGRKKKVDEVKPKIKIVSKKSGNRNAPNTVKQNRLELLVTIVGSSKAEYYLDLIQSFDVNMQILALARGTADENIRRLVGVSDLDKVVIFSVIQENKIPEALHELENKFFTIKNGKGIAYTISLSSIIGKLIYGFLSNNRMAVEENRNEQR